MLLLVTDWRLCSFKALVVMQLLFLPAVQPVPSDSVIRCSAEVESIQGRKIWLSARITDVDGEIVYAASRALFVTVKAAT